MGSKLKFIDLFAGLGGFHLALNKLGHECVFASELQNDLRELYSLNYPEMNPSNIVGDIHSVAIENIPKHDILCAGFPCQPFSQAGKREGLNDAKNGNHFSKIISILNLHKPNFIILENVHTLEGHDNGRTWQIILQELEKEYEIFKGVLSPHEFGIPQHRKRVYIVGRRHDKGGLNNFTFKNLGQSSSECHIKNILDKNSLDHVPLRKESQNQLNVWQAFLDNLNSTNVPRFPIWTAEFGATYPYEGKATHKYSIKELKKYRGAFGKEIKGTTKNEILECLPPYVRRGSENFPDWKINYIRKNREFYQENKDWIKDWIPKILDWEHSHQKLEWNCGNVELDLKDKIIQFRPSGIRVKNPDKSPALVLMNTQIPVVFDDNLNEFRYLNSREASKLQSMEELKYFPQPSSRAIRAFGNAVNVKVVYKIAKELLNI
jgi:DNA (cytosine-5)-methyltransferase 1